MSKEKENEGRPVRARTSTGQLRSTELMMRIVGDPGWARPTLVVEKADGIPARDKVCVTASSGGAGIPVAYWEGGELWVLALADEQGYCTVRLDSSLAEYLKLGGLEPRWPERVLNAMRVQRDIERVEAELARYVVNR